MLATGRLGISISNVNVPVALPQTKYEKAHTTSSKGRLTWPTNPCYPSLKPQTVNLVLARPSRKTSKPKFTFSDDGVKALGDEGMRVIL